MSDVNAVLSLQYEAQHFGFHPRNFLDSAYNVFFENISETIMQMKEHMIQVFKHVVHPFVIATQIERFMQHLAMFLDKSIDKLEVYLNRDVFSIGPHIILPEDEVHVKNPCTKEENQRLDTEIAELKHKILMEKAKSYNLKKKIQEQKVIKGKLLSFHNELKFLLTTANQEGVTPKSTESLVSDLQLLLDDISLQ